MNAYKPYVLTTMSLGMFLIAGHVFLLILVDPLNISMFDLTKNEFFIKEMRFQTAGIINKFEFDSAIVGSSVAQNFNARYADEKLGGTFQNLSLPGSLLEERKVVLNYLLAQKKVKTIIVSIDGVTKVQRNEGIPMEAWSLLYNESYVDDLSLYTNRKYFPYISCHSLFNNKVVAYILGSCPKDKITGKVEDLTEWQSDPFHYGRFGGIENWIKHKDNFQVERSIREIRMASNMLKNRGNSPSNQEEKWYEPREFSENVIPLIKSNPETRFILFFPPYSLYQFAIDVQTRPYFFSQYKDLVGKVVLEAELFTNAEVYWFNDEDFIADLAHYKDLTHYDAKLNSLFLDHFRVRRSMINVRNYQSLLHELERKANNIDLVAFASKFN